MDLNLELDGPEEFEGRVVRLDGAEYEIGTYLGEGGERYVHDLVNRRFGRVTHVIRILRDQENAEAISARNLETARQLREHGLPVVADHITVRAHGGVFEVREGVDLTGTEKEMTRALDAEQYDKAAATAERILATQPDNFIALNTLAAVFARRDDPYRGLKLALTAVEIEPNTRPCKMATMQCALMANAFRTFWWQFNDMRAKWPNDHSVDRLAALAHLTAGTPEKAVDLTLDDDVAEEVRQAVDAKRRAGEIMRSQFTHKNTAEDNAHSCDVLKQAYEIYSRSPNIAVNYGLALMRTGAGRAAHDVLAQILPMLDPGQHGEFLGYMAFGLAVDGDWDRAYQLLDHMVELLGDEEISPVDLPGWPLWWFEHDETRWWTNREGAMIYARSQRPCQLVTEVLARVGAERIRPAVRALVSLYAQHPCNPE